MCPKWCNLLSLYYYFKRTFLTEKRSGGSPFPDTRVLYFKIITPTHPRNKSLVFLNLPKISDSSIKIFLSNYSEFPNSSSSKKHRRPFEKKTPPSSYLKRDPILKYIFGATIVAMKRPQKGSTIKQYAYATRRLNGQGRSKKEIALLSGFSQSVAENAKYKIEETEGYQNAVIELAHKSNNLLLGVMAEFEARGLEDFSNKDLNAALNAISGAWDRIEKVRAPNKMKTPEGNRLRGIFTRETVKETAILESTPIPATQAPAPAKEEIIKDAEIVGDPIDDPEDF